jgi:diaminopimelate epimerase
MIIYNQDASHSSTCGNATRCVAQLLMKEIGKGKVTIETSSGTLIAQSEANRYISVDMGEPIFAWQQIPLAREDYASEFKFDSISSPFVVNMGNPHIVFVVSNVNLIKLAELGPQIEHHELFPQKVNVNFAEIVNPQIIKLRVWERGSGETLACGSGACATLVALAKQNLTERQATICLPGGDLQIKWLANNHVIMCGEAEVSFTGNIII